MAVSAKTILLTSAAMIAFAANSLLCRLALADGVIDATTFTMIRVGSAIAVLGVVMALRSQRPKVTWSCRDRFGTALPAA